MSVAEYAVPTLPPAKLDVEIDSVCFAAAMAMLSDFVAVLLPESMAVTVKDDVPVAEGVPEIAAVEELSVRPAGSEPLLNFQEYGIVPPLACKLAEYVVPTVPFGRDDVEMAKDPPPEPPPEPLAPAIPAHPSRVAIATRTNATSAYLELPFANTC